MNPALDEELRKRVEGLVRQAILRVEPFAQTSVDEIERAARELLPLMARGPGDPASRELLVHAGLAALRALVEHFHASVKTRRALERMRQGGPASSIEEE